MTNQKLYVMKNEMGLYKIGISKNPNTRVKQITRNSGVMTEVLHTFSTFSKSAYDVEQYLHKVFESKRRQGEWFDELTASDIEYISCYIKNHCMKIDCLVNYERGGNNFQLPCMYKVKYDWKKHALERFTSLLDDIEEFQSEDIDRSLKYTVERCAIKLLHDRDYGYLGKAEDVLMNLIFEQKHFAKTLGLKDLYDIEDIRTHNMYKNRIINDIGILDMYIPNNNNDRDYIVNEILNSPERLLTLMNSGGLLDVTNFISSGYSSVTLDGYEARLDDILKEVVYKTSWCGHKPFDGLLLPDNLLGLYPEIITMLSDLGIRYKSDIYLSWGLEYYDKDGWYLSYNFLSENGGTHHTGCWIDDITILDKDVLSSCKSVKDLCNVKGINKENVIYKTDKFKLLMPST